MQRELLFTGEFHFQPKLSIFQIEIMNLEETDGL